MPTTATETAYPKVASALQTAAAQPLSGGFWDKCQERLTVGEATSLATEGYVIHKFPNDRSLMLTLRVKEIPQGPQRADLAETFAVYLDAVDLKAKKLAGHFDFYVLPNIEAFAQYEINYENESVTPAAEEVLRRHAIGDSQIHRLFETAREWQYGFPALKVYPPYRRQDRTGYPLSHLLMGTAAIISKGFGFNVFYLLGVGERGRSLGASVRLLPYFHQEFGAEPYRPGDSRSTNMHISLHSVET